MIAKGFWLPKAHTSLHFHALRACMLEPAYKSEHFHSCRSFILQPQDHLARGLRRSSVCRKRRLLQQGRHPTNMHTFDDTLSASRAPVSAARV